MLLIRKHDHATTLISVVLSSLLRLSRPRYCSAWSTYIRPTSSTGELGLYTLPPPQLDDMYIHSMGVSPPPPKYPAPSPCILSFLAPPPPLTAHRGYSAVISKLTMLSVYSAPPPPPPPAPNTQ